MEEVLANADLRGHILSEAGWPARAVCEAWRRALDGDTRPAPPAEVLGLRDGTWSAELTKGAAARLCALNPDLLSAWPHAVRRRCGGGEYHIYAPQAILQIFEQHGGMAGLAERTARTRERARRLARTAEAAREAAEHRVDLLDRALAALGLAPRRDSYWQRRALGSAAFWRQNLRKTLTYAAWMHWLHECTGGEYEDAVEQAVRDEAEHRGYRPGIYAGAAESVQHMPRFRLPAAGLPWLPAGETTAAALDRAEEAADPGAAARKRRRAGTEARRAEAKRARHDLFHRHLAAAAPGDEVVRSLVLHFSPAVDAFLDCGTIKPPPAEAERAALAAVDTARHVAAVLLPESGLTWDAVPTLDAPLEQIAAALRAKAEARRRAAQAEAARRAAVQQARAQASAARAQAAAAPEAQAAAQAEARRHAAVRQERAVASQARAEAWRARQRERAEAGGSALHPALAQAQARAGQGGATCPVCACTFRSSQAAQQHLRDKRDQDHRDHREFAGE